MKTLLEYITSEEGKLIENVEIFTHQMMKRIQSLKRLKDSSNQFVLLVEIKDQYYVYFINDNGEIKNCIYR